LALVKFSFCYFPILGKVPSIFRRVGLHRKAKQKLSSTSANSPQKQYHVTRRCSSHASRAGQFVSRAFVVLLRKSIPQRATYKLPLNLTLWGQKVFVSCALKVRKSKTGNFLSWFVLGFLKLKLYRL